MLEVAWAEYEAKVEISNSANSRRKAYNRSQERTITFCRADNLDQSKVMAHAKQINDANPAQVHLIFSMTSFYTKKCTLFTVYTYQ